MTNYRRIRQIATFASALLTLTLAMAQFSVSQEKLLPPITKAQLAGTWTATLSGYTGCGETTLTTTFTLNRTGNGTQTSAVEHTLGCGDIDQTGQVAQLQVLNADGSGFIAFGCGAAVDSASTSRWRGTSKYSIWARNWSPAISWQEPLFTSKS